jgi:hypothetical protein
MKINFSFLLFISILLIGCQENKGVDFVSTSGRKILVNGSPYFMKGVCYHPVPKGSSERSFETIDQDLALMKEAGINTIRVYAPIEQVDILDKIERAGIKIILGFGYNQNGNYDILSGTFSDYVERFKNHNAILLWELGNEYNYHPEWFEGDIKNWYKALNLAAEKIHQIDKNRPVSSAHGDLPNEMALSLSPHVDIWGLNVYRWDDPSSIFMEWEATNQKPIYLSEAGADSYMSYANKGFDQGENQLAQAIANGKIIDATFKHTEIVSGILLFSFTDGWWKAGNPHQQDVGGWAPNSAGVPYDSTPNEEYWGMVDVDRNKKETFKVIKEKFNGFKMPDNSRIHDEH